MQQIPILKIGGSNPFGRAKKQSVTFSDALFFVRRDSKPERVSTVEKQSAGLFLGAKSDAAMPQGRKTRGKADADVSLRADQKIRQAWYIITRQRVYHQHGIAVLYLITPLGVYFCRLDDIQGFALIFSGCFDIISSTNKNLMR